MTSIIEEIVEKRKRQIEVHGYDAAHDDAHTDKSIARAAAAYAISAVSSAKGALIYPWDLDGFRPDGARNNLITAAALCIAEIERLDRAAAKASAANASSEPQDC